RDNATLLVSLTNPDLQRDGHVAVPRNTVHLERASVVHEGSCHTRLTLRNFERAPVDLVVAVGFDADFADLFEVTRRTTVSFDRPPVTLTANRAEFAVHLPPAGRTDLEITVDCRANGGA